MTTIEDARAALAEFEAVRFGPGYSEERLASVLRALIAEHERYSRDAIAEVERVQSLYQLALNRIERVREWFEQNRGIDVDPRAWYALEVIMEDVPTESGSGLDLQSDAPTASETPICARCGKSVRGFASVWHDGREDFYCHPDEGEDCYSLRGVPGSHVLATVESTDDEREALVEEAIRRYAIPAPVDYATTADYTFQVVFVQGRRQGFIDAGLRRQGPITDVAVEAAGAALYGVSWGDPDIADRDLVVAVLVAARDAS